ncbi:MAG: GGDEF domain-containing protein [Dehalococcoidia bacterium]|nr:MAG: GGDEF domain-containing protein [Dehalococcoidia bacterium]
MSPLSDTGALDGLDQCRLLSMAVAATPVALFVTDQHGRLLLFQGQITEALDRQVFFRRPDVVALIERALSGEPVKALLTAGPASFEIIMAPNPPAATDPGDGGFEGVTGVSGILTDATERERTVTALHSKLSRSPITGLRNRAAMTAEIDAATQSLEPGGSLCVVVVLIDRFDHVLESFGFASGSAILREVAQRLYGIDVTDVEIGSLELGKFTLFARLAPDRLTHFVRQIEAMFVKPVAVDRDSILIRPVMGVAIYPDHGDDGEMLIQKAERAARTAGERGELHRIHVAPAVPPRRNFAVLSELRSALTVGALHLEYQPLINLHTLEVDSVEALARWDHAVMGRIQPDEFIPIAEHSGMITDLTHFVIGRAALQGRAWHGVGHDMRVAVNVAPEDLRRPDFGQRLESALARQSVPFSAFTIEVTERTDLGRMSGATLLQLQGLVRQGLEISIDDFGTGFSNIGSLHQLPCTQIKIDRSFVAGVNTDERSERIVSAMIQFGHSLGRTVVAEGIETPEQWDTLRALGCDLAQGYFIARPMPFEEVHPFLERASWR